MVYQFEMCFPNDVYGEHTLMEKFARILDLIDDEEEIEDILQKKAYINFASGEGRFVCIDYSSEDYIMPLVVICLDNYAEKVRAAMFEWDNECREEYGQKPRISVENVFHSEGYTLLKEIEKYNNISIHDKFLKYE